MCREKKRDKINVAKMLQALKKKAENVNAVDFKDLKVSEKGIWLKKREEILTSLRL